MNKIFRASRYGAGDDYLNCPFSETEYTAFYQAVFPAPTSFMIRFCRVLRMKMRSITYPALDILWGILAAVFYFW